VDNCLDKYRGRSGLGGQTSNTRTAKWNSTSGLRSGKVRRAGEVNVTTGEIQRIYEGRAPGVAASLTTAGDVVLWGNINRKFRAFDADSGKVLWETTLQGPVSNSTITYAVNGKQHVAVLVGNGGLLAGLMRQAGMESTPFANALYVFALP